RLRAAVPSASQWKRGVAGESRPFAGVNVLLLGDFYQLPPPCGRELALSRCRLTAAERESRRRVIAGPGDPRLGDEKFRWAAAIVANNDAKYNKDRAEGYSRAAESPLRWSVALDAPSAEVLQTQECDKAARIRWLQYHDRGTKKLSGMLPLAVGTRVVLADHLDRAEDKLLLQGSAGRVHSWVWKENDLRPTCVYVKFDGATWQLDGAPEPGLYPVYPARKVWKLDAKRKKPALKIARTQLPLAPAYAITAHGSQGKTLPAALVDFNVDRRTDVTFGTVAASRVRSREDVLILRPFERWLYTRGAPEGPALLLKQLRGEEVDWDAFRVAWEKCKEAKTLDYFSGAGQKTLKRKLPSDLARLDCRGCKFRKLEHAFPRAQLQQDESEAKRRCLKCLKGAARGEASAQRQRCLNCAARGSRAKDCHSCRKCGKQWIERQAVGALPLLPGIGVAPQDPEAHGLNGKQLELVVERVLVELELVPPDHEIALRRAEPLAWLLHGPPGTGKSHVLKFLLFEEQLGYAQGIDYEVAAFQAVHAADIRGRTLHNACGLGVDAAALDRAVSQEAAKRMSYWRWLVVDEISMVNARLLAQVEQRLRAVVPSASQWKRGVAGESRPFAGVNVLLLGDFYQLPPPSGGYLADVPSSRRPPRLSAATPSVTELEERERCKDDWWNEVVDELRRGKLSEENWRYLHGKPVEGCRLTAAERESRRRVIAGPGDPRLGEEKFRWAAAIDYSCAAESPLRWSVALDAPSAEVLQTQECDKAARIRWLQYHDRDTRRTTCGRPASYGATWQLDGAPEPGLYPVYPARKVWKLDAKRKKPVLKIARTQLPLAPAYAITAHGSQGKTLPAALVDFNVDRRTDVTFGTVAASRVRSREDVLILRPFERWLYTRG
ncbi:unnamed protein product, partial [Effrenium voratum]